MTGYCGKTDQPGNTSFRCLLVNVTPSYYAEGKAFYAARARPRLSKLICLDRKNILLKAYTYATLMIRDRCTDLVTIILRMLQSGKYYPCASWVITYAGQGMDVARAQTIFKAMLTPAELTREDVVFLLFKTITRWEKAKYFSWAAQYRQHAATWAQDWIDGPEVSHYVNLFVFMMIFDMTTFIFADIMQDMTDILTDDNGNCSSKYNPDDDLDRLMEAMLLRRNLRSENATQAMKNATDNSTQGK